MGFHTANENGKDEDNRDGVSAEDNQEEDDDSILSEE